MHGNDGVYGQVDMYENPKKGLDERETNIDEMKSVSISRK